LVISVLYCYCMVSIIGPAAVCRVRLSMYVREGDTSDCYYWIAIQRHAANTPTQTSRCVVATEHCIIYRYIVGEGSY